MPFTNSEGKLVNTRFGERCPGVWPPLARSLRSFWCFLWMSSLQILALCFLATGLHGDLFCPKYLALEVLPSIQCIALNCEALMPLVWLNTSCSQSPTIKIYITHYSKEGIILWIYLKWKIKDKNDIYSLFKKIYSLILLWANFLVLALIFFCCLHCQS